MCFKTKSHDMFASNTIFFNLGKSVKFGKLDYSYNFMVSSSVTLDSIPSVLSWLKFLNLFMKEYLSMITKFSFMVLSIFKINNTFSLWLIKKTLLV